jgi:hypothetical protein
VVTAAGYLLYALAALQLLLTIVSLSTASHAIDTIDDIYARDGISNGDTVAKASIYVSAVVEVLIVALFVILAVFVLRGKNAMRITTWVVAGLGVLCTLCGVAGNGVATTMSNQQNGVSNQDTAALKDAVPGWARGTTLTVDVLVLVALIAVIILLTLSASNAYFRKPAPTMMVGYPAYPGYPPVFPQAGAPGSPAPSGDTTWAAPGSVPPGQVAPGSVPPPPESTQGDQS